MSVMLKSELIHHLTAKIKEHLKTDSKSEVFKYLNIWVHSTISEW